MAWRLEHQQRQIYARNPLASVVFELRYKPILRVPERQRIAAFQDKIRDVFSEYEEADASAIQVDSAGGILAIQREGRYLFKTSDHSAVVGLGSSSLSVETRRHEKREDFFAQVEKAVDALRSEYSPVYPVRLGLRYVNLIDLAKVSQDLGRDVEPTDVVAPALLEGPLLRVDIHNTQVACEVRSVMPAGGGALTFRYGIAPKGTAPCRLDVDRYIEDNVQLGDIGQLLTQFSDDIFSVFVTAAGTGLLEWMGPSRAPTEG